MFIKIKKKLKISSYIDIMYVHFRQSLLIIIYNSLDPFYNFLNIPHLEPFLTIHMIIHCQYGCNQCVFLILVNASLSTQTNLVKKRKKKKLNKLDLQLTCDKYYTKKDKRLLIMRFSLTHWLSAVETHVWINPRHLTWHTWNQLSNHSIPPNSCIPLPLPRLFVNTIKSPNLIYMYLPT